uniref:Uncharacterized protein n=1 Tax=Globodera rostochiensis TaxID=31243 RepID=A0A914IEM0_GLORO
MEKEKGTNKKEKEIWLPIRIQFHFTSNPFLTNCFRRLLTAIALHVLAAGLSGLWPLPTCCTLATENGAMREEKHHSFATNDGNQSAKGERLDETL